MRESVFHAAPEGLAPRGLAVAPGVALECQSRPHIGEDGLAVTDWGTLECDDNMMTTLPGVFAGGDIARGASLVVWAVRDGRDVAEKIDTYLVEQRKPSAAAA